MPLARRFLVLQALLLWQGGFVFYAAVVVPAGTELFGATGQGLVTRRVTPTLNAIGLVCLALLAWDAAAARDPAPRRVAARGWLVGVAAALLYLLWYFHRVLVFALDARGELVELPGLFRAAHVAYLWASTFHWLIGLALAWLTLAAWRAEDGSNGPPATRTSTRIENR